ncbi:serine--tRNA ligase [Streptomyces sp. NPDC057429]|uniref:serine--tRNA ligase n=1 Tax=Streptomyces sp. NPDC057429 TaxID=3346130 RepID=UPI0036C0BC57
MHDANALIGTAAESVRRLGRRGYALDVPLLEKLVQERARSITRADELRARMNRLTRSIQDAPAADRPRLAQEARAGKAEVREADRARLESESALHTHLLTVPNLPLDRVPDGGPQDEPQEVRRWGAAPDLAFTPRDHVELARSQGILDPDRAGKLSGARFAVLRGAGAALERALAAFLLDLHTREHGYREYSLPQLVTRETMTGTGQLPKFEEDLFRTSVGERELFLIPTAEVPLVNLFREETLDAAELPMGLTAHTTCYRSEAGSYGRDTRGLIRLHQFSKVELVRLCHPADAEAQLDLLLGHAEECLRRLDLHYRVVELNAGDLGFSARRTFDLEVWLPGQQAYREISSVSDCGTFQARRARISVRTGGAREPLVTLNGSGLPLGRTLVALLEQHQNEDGSLTVPPALVPYTGFTAIAPDGTTVPA